MSIDLRKIPELLAPAGSPEALHSAIAAGADAVYLSGKRFGARKFAANFNDSDMKEAIDYAHLQNKNVYVTVNTLIREDELLDLAGYLVRLYELGADAILMQDLGAASLAGQLVPHLARHASTQMTIHNLYGALYAAQAGFKRAVLAREVILEEIKRWGQIAAKAGLGLEVFIHGALCYSYSGQCLLSSSIGGRSGNRGMCAQPCRKSYVLMHGRKDEYGRPVGLEAVALKESYIISTRDLSVYRHLDKIVRSPVQSLKIEGRMKSAEYVAIVTSIYRRALDSIARGRGTWAPSEQDERDLALAFNRDFTAGHLLGAKDVMGRGMSDNRGVLIGSVASYDTQKGEAAVRLSGSLLPERGDGLVIQSPGQETGFALQKAFRKDGLLRIKTPERVKPGARVFLTGSTALARKAEEIRATQGKAIPVDISLTIEDRVPLLEARLDGGKRVQLKAGFRMQKAENRPLSPEQIESQLRKTGGTPFAVREVEMDYPGDLFVPLSALNQFRRDLLQEVEKALLAQRRPSRESVAEAKDRLKEYRLPGHSAPETGAPMKSGGAAMKADGPVIKAGRAPLLAAYAGTLEVTHAAWEGGCQRIYFEPEAEAGIRKDRGKGIRSMLAEAREICRDIELVWKWPKITRDAFIDQALPLLREVDVDGVMVENVGAAWAVQKEMPDIRLFGGGGLNVYNHMTVQALSPPFVHLTASPELSIDQLARTIAATHAAGSAPELELVVQGNLEVMVAEDCIPCLAGKEYSRKDFWGLQDLRRIFPLSQDIDGRTHIFNSAETCLVDLMPQIFRSGLDGIALDARERSGRYAREMARIYSEAVRVTKEQSSTRNEDLVALKEEAKALSIGGITTGHFLKGLKEELS